eukprot:gene13866-18597_t
MLNEDTNSVIKYAVNFESDGFAIVEGVFDKRIMDCMAQTAVEMLQQAQNKINCDELSFGVGAKDGFKELVQRHLLRFEMTYKIGEITELKHQDLIDVLLYQSQIDNVKNQNESITTNDVLDFNKILKESCVMDVVSKVLDCSDFVLANHSVVISLPGCESQSWHADGPHMSISQHLPCHCVNVFIPLVDLTIENGATEIRPGSQVYTRDLTKLYLAAFAKKQVKPSQTPLLKRGSVLMFDYRVLHRGLKNSSNLPRPILVYTFAKPWFKDMLNFPTRSIFDNDQSNNIWTLGSKLEETGDITDHK